MHCLIQARISSTRLPGKVLKKIEGKEMLYHLVTNLKKSKLIKKIFVLTSNSIEDDKICDFCKKHNINFFRGPLQNTFLRFYSFLKKNDTKNFIRLSGDSPLLNYKLVDAMILSSKKKNYDIFTNIFPRTFPKGQSIEIIKTKSFLSIKNKFLNNEEKEHLTKYFYNNPLKFNIYNYRNNINYSNYNLSVDTENDFKIVKKIFQGRQNEVIELKELIRIYKNITK
tara:strand:- start:2632 stop:3306 length:675 start_codon:yes stop_codon:yes gene_type:complete